MDCDCGEGCCPSANPLHIQPLKTISSTDPNYILPPLMAEIRSKINELVEKHNIILENQELKDHSFERLWRVVNMLEEEHDKVG